MSCKHTVQRKNDAAPLHAVHGFGVHEWCKATEMVRDADFQRRVTGKPKTTIVSVP
jgi:hypothetical protein